MTLFLNPQGEILEANRTLLEAVGCSMGSLSGKNISALLRSSQTTPFAFRDQGAEGLCDQDSTQQSREKQREQRLLLETREHFEALQQRTARFEQVVREAPLGVVEVALQSGEIIAANPCALQIFERDHQSLCGAAAEQWIPQLLSLQSGIVHTLQIQQGEDGERALHLLCYPKPDGATDSATSLVLLLRDPKQKIEWPLLRFTRFGQLFLGADERGCQLLSRDGALTQVEVEGVVILDDADRSTGYGVMLRELIGESKQSEFMRYEAFQEGQAEMSAFVLHNVGNAMQGVNDAFYKLAEQEMKMSKAYEILSRIQVEAMSPDPAIALSGKEKQVNSTLSHYPKPATLSAIDCLI